MVSRTRLGTGYVGDVCLSTLVAASQSISTAGRSPEPSVAGDLVLWRSRQGGRWSDRDRGGLRAATKDLGRHNGPGARRRGSWNAQRYSRVRTAADNRCTIRKGTRPVDRFTCPSHNEGR